MEPALLMTGIIIFLSHALEAMTGFGCTIFALPFITLLFGIYEAKVLLTCVGWILSLYIVATKYQKIVFRQFFIIVLTAGFSMPLGIYFFNHLPTEIITLVLGVFIVATATIQLRSGNMSSQPKSNQHHIWNVLFLVVGGVFHGAFATGGPFIVFYAAKKLRDKGEFRATLSLLWLTLNTILFLTDPTFQPILNHISGFVFKGASMTKDVHLLMGTLPFLLAGIVVGEIIHRRVNAKHFHQTVFGVLFATGLFMIATYSLP
jgi:uncharacterized membrane protein YfcA